MVILEQNSSGEIVVMPEYDRPFAPLRKFTIHVFNQDVTVIHHTAEKALRYFSSSLELHLNDLLTIREYEEELSQAVVYMVVWYKTVLALLKIK